MSHTQYSFQSKFQFASMKRLQTSFPRAFVAGLSALILTFGFSGCRSKPILEKDDVKVTRDEPSESCKPLGAIEGRVITLRGTQEQAMENLKEEAVKKGANWVKIDSIGAQGTTIRGQAYSCL